MKKFALLFAFSTSCSNCISTNYATSYAVLMDKRANCTPLVTTSGCSSTNHYDTAVCNVGAEVWDCVADTDGRERPNCTKVRDRTPEKQ